MQQNVARTDTIQRFFQQNYLAALPKNLPTALITLDKQLRVQFVNQQAAALFQYPASELQRIDLRRLFHSDEWNFLGLCNQQVLRYGAKAVPQGIRVEGKNKSNDAIIVRLYFNVLPESRQAIWSIILIRNTLPHLDHSVRRKYSTRPAPDSAIDATIILTADDKIQSLSRGACMLFGFTPAAMIGQPFTKLLPQDLPTRKTVLKELFLHDVQRQVNSCLADLIGKGDRRLTTDCYSTALKDQRGNRLGTAVTFYDNTGWRKIEHKIIHNERILALGQLSTSLAHEIKNPLHSMVINMEILRSRIHKDAPQAYDKLEKYLNILSSEVTRLDSVVRGLLDFAKPMQGHFKPIRINEVFMNIMELIYPQAKKQGVQIVAKLPSDLPNVRAEESQLKQIFLNLTLNALQAMPKGGKLTVRTKRLRSGRVRFSITDTGQGIARQHMPQIFNLYFSTRERGTGLGLPMVLRLVENQGGAIRVRSTLKRGSHFSITFPSAS